MIKERIMVSPFFLWRAGFDGGEMQQPCHGSHYRSVYHPNAALTDVNSGRQFGDSRHEARCTDLLGGTSERVRRSAPAQRLDVGEERRVGTQHRQFLEEEREFHVIAEDVR